MKLVFILADSVNRRFLDIYGSKEAAITPNINRLASIGTVFDNHWTGSAPCMPARRDLMTGRINFLEKPWGCIEPFDVTLPALLKKNNVYTHIVTDHYHYMEKGGENFLNQFCSYDIVRGQEHDSLNMKVGKSGFEKPSAPEGYKGTYDFAHDITYSQFRNSDEYPTPVVLQKATSWLEKNKDADNFMLWVECFDPHEPYDVTQQFIDLYNNEEDSYSGQTLNWPNYRENIFSEVETRHLRKLYKAQLTMTDHYISKIFDVMDKYSMWEDTAVIFTTDHGFMLGEHGYMAKNYMPAFNEVFNIPMIIYKPGITVKRFGGITQNTDILPTVCNLFGVDTSITGYPLHGIDLFPALEGRATSAHKEIIFGNFGASVNYYDGRYVYMRSAADVSNKPLNIYTAMPVTFGRYLGYGTIKPEDYSKIGYSFNYAGYPVYKIPSDIVNIDKGSQRFEKRDERNANSVLYDIQADYNQNNPVIDTDTENKCIEGLIRCMKTSSCPSEQLERLGL